MVVSTMGFNPTTYWAQGLSCSAMIRLTHDVKQHKAIFHIKIDRYYIDENPEAHL